MDEPRGAYRAVLGVGCLKAGLFLSWFDGVPGRPGKSQKEGQEDQKTLKALEGSLPDLLHPPGPPGLLQALPWPPPHQGSLRKDPL